MRRSLPLLAVLVGLVAACDDATPCNLSYSCPSGQTCAAKDGKSFACAPAGPGQLDATCDETLGAAVACGDGLTCLQTSDVTAPTCLAWCGADGKCAPDRACTSVRTTLGVTLALCMPCNLSYACGAGQTCATATGASFSCMPSGAGVGGAPCDGTASVAVCGDRLVCVAAVDPTMATCVSWCDNEHPCPSGKTCKTLDTTTNASLRVCL